MLAEDDDEALSDHVATAAASDHAETRTEPPFSAASRVFTFRFRESPGGARTSAPESHPSAERVARFSSALLCSDPMSNQSNFAYSQSLKLVKFPQTSHFCSITYEATT